MRIVVSLLCLLTIFMADAQAGFFEKHRTKQAITVQKDIAFGRDAKQRLDIYVPKKVVDVYAPTVQETSYPVMIFVHGGGWQIGDKKRFDDMGVFYATRGVVLVTVNYRLSPKHPHPAQAQDVAASVAWVKQHIHRYGGDRDDITLAGHSAGAHLAALVGSDPSYLQAHRLPLTTLRRIVPVDTASMDLTRENPDRIRRIQRAIYETFGQDPKELERASPLYHVQNAVQSLPEFRVFVTNRREDAVLQSREFYDAAKAQGGVHYFYVIDGLSHRAMSQHIYKDGSEISMHILNALKGE